MEYYIIAGAGQNALRANVEGALALSNKTAILYLPFNWENAQLADELTARHLADKSLEEQDGKNCIVLRFNAEFLYARPVAL